MTDRDDHREQQSEALRQAASDLTQFVTMLYDCAESAQETLSEALADADKGQGTPEPIAMTHLWNTLVSMRVLLNATQRSWRAVNDRGQHWALIHFKPSRHLSETQLNRQYDEIERDARGGQ